MEAIHAMSNKDLLAFLFPDRPFFGGGTVGIQGARVRHVFMSAAVSLKATETPSLSILEVGSWTGSSTLTWCEAIDTYAAGLGSVLCVDPWIAEISSAQTGEGTSYRLMQSMAKLDFAYDMFRHNIRFTSPDVPVHHMRGKAADILPYLKDDGFDIMFIDGDHSYDGALLDIRAAKRLVKPGGFICGDDLELQGSECDLAVLRANAAVDCITFPDTGKFCHPGVTLAVHEEFGDVSAYFGFWIMRKLSDGRFEKVALLDQKPFIPQHFSEEERADARQALQDAGLT